MVQDSERLVVIYGGSLVCIEFMQAIKKGMLWEMVMESW